jgi:hypothetical protein
LFFLSLEAVRGADDGIFGVKEVLGEGKIFVEGGIHPGSRLLWSFFFACSNTKVNECVSS